MNLMGVYLLISQRDKKMNEYKSTDNKTIFTPATPKSIASIGGESYKTTLAIDQRFNWFQKLMWKWCFGVKIEDYKGA